MRIIIAFLLYVCCAQLAMAQKTVTEVYTDFGGFWRSGIGSINKIAPDDSHNLLAFKVDTTIYSTGVNNLALMDRDINYVALLFKALPVQTVGAGGIIGLGSNYSGEIVNDPIRYLTDGINGLDLCTGMFNFQGSNVYTISSVSPAAIGDGIPDILIPQIGDPSNSLDRFRFIDSLGGTVGKEVAVNFNGITAVGNNNWKFYTRANPPRVGAASAGNRSLRIVAYDYADLGITTENYERITGFVHHLSGTSDQPFIAYNNSSFVVVAVGLKSFQAAAVPGRVNLGWIMTGEGINGYFDLQRSVDGERWKTIATVAAKKASGEDIHYQYQDAQPAAGVNYYRLRLIYADGSVRLSGIQKADLASVLPVEVKLYPNPASNFIEFRGLDGVGNLQISSLNGTSVLRLHDTKLNSLKVDISGLRKGVYFASVYYKNGLPATRIRFVKE